MTAALIALGSNLGERKNYLDETIKQLAANPRIQVVAVSSWRATSPIGGPPGQPEFLNGAALLETSLDPHALQSVLEGIEAAAGRSRQVTWDARTLDLDLLLYGSEVIDSPRLIVPHPRMTFRRFVIEPAAEIAPKMVHPVIRWTIETLRDHLRTALPYIAITGPPGVGKTELAKAAASATGGRFLADPARGEIIESDELSTHAIGREIKFSGLRVQQLAAVDWDGGSTSAPAISDYWIEQSACYALLPRGQFLQSSTIAGMSRAHLWPAPKLHVFLDTDSPTPEFDLLRKLLRKQLMEPNRGPILWLDGVPLVLAITQLVAAIQAMESR